tara:strand:- start:64 stop:450 length:387 start_codon:yes stop_codon:yes gene_type:complete
MIKKYILASIIGSVVGFLGGLQGIAGAFYISALLLSLGVLNTQRLAAGTTLLSILPPISLGAVYTYWKTGDVDVGVAIAIAITYTIMAYFGAQFNKKISQKNVLLSISILMLLTSIYFFYSYLYLDHT